MKQTLKKGLVVLMALVMLICLLPANAITANAVEKVDAPVAGVAYKFGMIQKNKSETDVYYLKGGMAQTYYLDTTTDVNQAIDVYLEAANGGYYLYTLINGTKTYINMVVSGTHVNGKYESKASTVYRYDATSKTLIADVDGSDYWFGTRNDRDFTTVGPCATKYNGFYCTFYQEAPAACAHTNTKVEGAKTADCTNPGHTGKTVCADCGATVKEGTVINAIGHNYANGVCTVCGASEPAGPSGSDSATYVMADYVVAGELGGAAIVRDLDANVKLSISSGWISGDTARIYKGSYGVIQANQPITTLVLNVGYKNSTFDVYVSEDGENWTKHSNHSYTVSYADVTINFDTPAQYIKLDAANQQIRFKSMTVTCVPACTHANTKVDGAVDATCTAPGNTGKTVCADCGETISENKVIDALGHNEVIDAGKDATCTEAGKTEGKHCDRCNEVLVAQDEIAALGHVDADNDDLCDRCDREPDDGGDHTVVLGMTVIMVIAMSALAVLVIGKKKLF